MAQKARVYLVACAIFAVVLLLGLVASRQLFTRAVQAEAKLMMSYLHTLERVHRLENKEFVYWNEFYGATQNGEDHCAQPEEAAEMGFLLPGCHRENAVAPRYAYRVVKQEDDRYRVEAKSGSDRLGRSIVCFDTMKFELWASMQNMDDKLVESCN